MTEKQLKGYVLRLFKYKSISPRQFFIAKNNLEQLKESDPLFYYFNMGKLHTSFGNVDDAIEYLTKAVSLKGDHFSSYYNLYKCFVKKGNVELASRCFNEFLRYNEADLDFSFPIQIMRTIASIDRSYLDYMSFDSTVEESSRIGYNDLSDNESLLNVYKNVIKLFNNRDYAECIQMLNRMNFMINEDNYPMEVDTLTSLIRILKDKEINGCKKTLAENKLEEMSDNEYCKFQLRLLGLGHYNEESFLRKIEELIENDSMSKARCLLENISSEPKFNEYLDMIDYLNGFIREKDAFLSLSLEQQEEFTSRRLHAKAQYKRKQNDASLESYTSLKEDFGLPICDYYIGKILFRKGMFSQAKDAFLNYLEQGGTKAEKAYMFIGKIERIKKNKSEARRWVNKMHKIHKVFARDFDYMSDKNYKRRKRLGLDKDEADQNDVVKKKKSRYIRMNEEDFSKPNEVLAEDYYEADVDGKLSIIRGLYRRGHVDTANKLFEEIQRECAPEERGKVKQFGRNKKIYKNQNRTGL